MHQIARRAGSVVSRTTALHTVEPRARVLSSPTRVPTPGFALARGLAPAAPSTCYLTAPSSTSHGPELSQPRPLTDPSGCRTPPRQNSLPVSSTVVSRSIAPVSTCRNSSASTTTLIVDAVGITPLIPIPELRTPGPKVHRQKCLFPSKLVDRPRICVFCISSKQPSPTEHSTGYLSDALITSTMSQHRACPESLATIRWSHPVAVL